MHKVLVTGATGNIGAQIVADLQAQGIPLRAFTRNSLAAAHKLGPGVDIHQGDFADSASIARALEGISHVLLSSSNHPLQAEHEFAVIDAAAGAGVERIVKLSTVSAEVGSRCAFFDAHGRAEQHLREARTRSVILQSSFYMSNLFAVAETVRTMGKIFAPVAGARLSMIDPRDVASVAVTALFTDRYDRRTLHLTGPESITYDQVAQVLTDVTGRQVEFISVPDEVARQNLAATGMPQWFVDQIILLFGLIREGVAEKTSDTVHAVIGRRPGSFAYFAHANGAAFRAAEAPTLGG